MKFLIQPFLITLTVIFGFATGGQTQIANPHQTVDRSIFAAPPLPPGTGAPGRRSDISTRIPHPECGLTGVSLTALAPIYRSQNGDGVWGLTVSERPTFWFYTGYQLPCFGEFTLWDSNNQVVYQSKVTSPHKRGVVSLTLPASAAPLAIGKPYHWFFKVYNSANNPPNFVDGWIQRNAPSSALSGQLGTATPQQRISLLAANGFWYDALTDAAKLRQTSAENGYWVYLLQSVELKGIAAQPQLDCCKPENSIR